MRRWIVFCLPQYHSFHRREQYSPSPTTTSQHAGTTTSQHAGFLETEPFKWSRANWSPLSLTPAAPRNVGDSYAWMPILVVAISNIEEVSALSKYTTRTCTGCREKHAHASRRTFDIAVSMEVHIDRTWRCAQDTYDLLVFLDHRGRHIYASTADINPSNQIGLPATLYSCSMMDRLYLV